MPEPLPNAPDFKRFSFVELDEEGYLVGDGRRIDTRVVNAFLDREIYLGTGTTDVFVWVHGWRNTEESARQLAQRLFAGIESVQAKYARRYPRLHPFKPEFVAVHWPSDSLPTAGGYEKIKKRAHQMTLNGHAEYVLASLLGYLESKQPAGGKTPTDGVLQAKGGFYVHCVGHSFGGRFLSEAIAAAAEPEPPKGILRAPEGKYPYTVDSVLLFQMAAPPDIFEKHAKLGRLVKEAPVRGPICLTHSPADKANCLWHKKMEGVQAVGCLGATGPTGAVSGLSLRPLDEDYTPADFKLDLTNIDAQEIYRHNPWYSATGAHSDYWYEESIHLLLSLANLARA